MLENVIPKLDQVPVDGVNPTAKLELVRTLAELSPFAGPIKNANTLLMSLFNATAVSVPHCLYKSLPCRHDSAFGVQCELFNV